MWWPIVIKDVVAAGLENLQSGREELEPTDRLAAFATNEEPVAIRGGVRPS